MRILFIGDSIIRGTTGVNWIRHLARKHPDWSIENEGVNGDTLIKIKARLERKLKLTRSYDAVMVEGGVNDLLIPSLQDRGYFFQKAYNRLTQRGYQPLEDAQDIAAIFHDMVNLIRHRTQATVILSTIGCMSEDRGFYLNEKKDVVNDIIRCVARDSHCHLADAGKIFDQYLVKRKANSYFLENFFNTAWLDSFQCNVLNRADALSRKRKLYLTIDGVHLNSRGGVVWLHEAEKQLLRLHDPKWLKTLRSIG